MAKRSALTAIHRELLARARTSGQVERRDLRNGARIAVQLAGGQIRTTFSRKDVPVGDDELKTFLAHCGVPTGAQRLPAEGQQARPDGRQTRYIVGYEWPDTPPMALFTEGAPRQ